MATNTPSVYVPAWVTEFEGIGVLALSALSALTATGHDAFTGGAAVAVTLGSAAIAAALQTVRRLYPAKPTTRQTTTIP